MKKTDKKIRAKKTSVIIAICTMVLLGVVWVTSSSPFLSDLDEPPQSHITQDSESAGTQGNAQLEPEQPQDPELPEDDAQQDTQYESQYDEAIGDISDDREDEPEPDDTPPELPDALDEITTTDEPPVWYGGALELPVRGATGWAAASLGMYSQPGSNATRILTLPPGQAFTILQEQDLWWHIRLSDEEEGWVRHRHSFINLPDVIPSIIYNITNAYSSVKRSNMYEIPEITGYMLYEAYDLNIRLGRTEFIVPALYSTSLKIMSAQQAALEDGNTLIIYEMFRPRDTQLRVADSLRNLMNTNTSVYRAINNPPWSMGWFIGTNLSNHQRGIAVDMSLGSIVVETIGDIGGFSYRRIDEYEAFEMPTAMHELSAHAVLLSRPVDANSRDAWRGISFADTITEGTELMVRYATDAGLTPIASEWWHFTDLPSRAIANEANIVGEFNTPNTYSILP